MSKFLNADNNDNNNNDAKAIGTPRVFSKISQAKNFSFSHNVFYSIKDRNYHFCYIQFVVCKLMLSIWSGQKFVVWAWVNSTVYSLTSK